MFNSAGLNPDTVNLTEAQRLHNTPTNLFSVEPKRRDR